MIRSHRNTLIALAVVSAMAAVVVTIGFGRSDSAGAFGSVNIVGTNQRPVHEPITRTLGCAAANPVTDCFQGLSLDILAGRTGTWGAVAEPDNPLDGFPNPAARHCDDIDYGYGSFHTKADAQGEFDKCLQWYQAYMDFAVSSAAGLLRPDGTIDPAQTAIVNRFGSTSNACTFPDPKKGNTTDRSAKCNVLNGLGRALHNYEDIWSHSNWGDVADPSAPIGLENPVGLGNIAQPAFMAYPGPATVPIPDGFLSGCDDSIPALNNCVQAQSGAKRTAHSMVNKDNGTVDPRTCATSEPLTARGAIVVDGVTNFQRAITGACGAARRAWSDLGKALVARYGATAATTMIRAITVDHPLTDCAVSGSAAKAQSPPVGDLPSARAVTIFVINRTSTPLSCATAVLDGGEWSSYPADSIAPGATARWRAESDGFMTGTSGGATFRAGSGSGSDGFSVGWNNPYVGSNSSTCAAPSGYTCERTGGVGNDATVTVTFSGP